MEKKTATRKRLTPRITHAAPTMKTRSNLFPGVALYRRVRRATSPNSIARRGFAGMIREARRNRDSAETELSRDYFQWRAELLRDKAEYYCQPNTQVTHGRAQP